MRISNVLFINYFAARTVNSTPTTRAGFVVIESLPLPCTRLTEIVIKSPAAQVPVVVIFVPVMEISLLAVALAALADSEE